MALSLPIETERLTLRRFRHDDRERFLSYRRDPETARFQGWDADYSDELADAFFAEMTTADVWRDAEWFQIAVEHDGVLVGDLGVCPGRDHFEIGFTLHPDSRGRGFAREAVRAVIDASGVEFVVAYADRGNAASQRLLEAVGFGPGGADTDEELHYKLAIAGTSTLGP